MQKTNEEKIVKLNNANYYNWKFKMEMLLIKSRLWKHVQGIGIPTETEEAALAKWKEADDDARATISLNIEDDQIRHVRDCTSAKQAWTKLKEYHEKSTCTRKTQLMRVICDMKMEEDGDMEMHINQMNEMFGKLASIGEEKLSEAWRVPMLLRSLPESYDILVTALEARDEATLTLNVVQSKLIEEYQKKKANSPGTDSLLQVGSSRNYNVVKCHFCQCDGHVRNDCEKYKRWLKKKSTERQQNGNSNFKMKSNEGLRDGNQSANVISPSQQNYIFVINGCYDNRWIVDSGATCHISNEKGMFRDIDYNVKERICVANGQSVISEGRGTCVANFLNSQGQKASITIQDVYFMPKISSNLLSVKCLSKKGFKIIFEKDSCQICLGDKEIAVAELSSNLYAVKNYVPQSVYLSPKSCKINCIHYWHRLLGHRDPSAIKDMVSQRLVEGIVLVDCGCLRQCDVCMKAKFSRLPFPKKSLTTTTSVLELIHTDVCGPMQTESHGGMRYFVTFIDDYSRYSMVYFIKRKSDVFKRLKYFLALGYNKFQRFPKKIRSDRGGEYLCGSVTEFLLEKGIEIEKTNPYSPEQNGVAERKNRSLVEMSKCMLLDAQLPNIYWAEAVSTANRLQNKLPTKAIINTPMERWDAKKPSFENEHVFGCKGYVFIPSQKRRKFDNKSRLMTFIGYDNGTKGFRMVDVETSEIQISRNVRFALSNEEFNITSESEISFPNVPTSTRRIAQDRNLPSTSTFSNTWRLEGNDSSVEDEVDDDLNASFESAISEGSDFINEELITDQAVEDIPIAENPGEPIHPVRAEVPIVENPREPAQPVRVSLRSNKGVPPLRFEANISILSKEPANIKEVMSFEEEERTKWLNAMYDEFHSLQSNSTWELVDAPPGRKIVGCKWVFKRKINEKGDVSKYKARLVAQGYSQKYGEDYDEVFAPVVKQTTLRCLLSIAGKRKLQVYHFDVKTAFLNGNLTESIYMKQPPGFEVDGSEGKVCLLRKSLYGLKQAARAWNQLIHSVLVNAGYRQSNADPCLYSKDGYTKCYVLIYVDDILVISKSTKDIMDCFHTMNNSFETNNLGPVKHYLGLQLERDLEGNFMISQSTYINKVIEETGLSDAKESKMALNPSYNKSGAEEELLLNNKVYQKVIGSLLYLAVNSRPDISASISILARKVCKPNKEDWLELKRVLRYLKGTAHMKLKLSGSEKSEETFLGYADADWAESKDDRKSNSGYVFILNGGLVSWCCRKQTCVSLSSTEAEFIALAEACQEAKWLRSLIKDLDCKIEDTTTIFEDNQSCLKLLKSENFSNRTKHIDTKYFFIKDYIANNIIKCEYCPTESMLADIMTKPLPISRLEKLRGECGLS